MSGEAVYKTSSASASGSHSVAITNGSFATVAFLSITGGGASSYPVADFVLKCSFAANVASGKTVDIYRRDSWGEGAPDVPAAGNSQQYVGSFPLKSAHGTTVTIANPAIGVPLGVAPTAEFFLYNGADQILASNYSVYCHPYTLGTAA